MTTNNMDTLSELLGIPEDMTADALVPAQADDVALTQANVAPNAIGATIETVDASIPKDEQELDEDLQAARKNLKDIANRAAKAAEAAILLAESGDSAKAFEAVARMTEAIVSANKELIEIHRTAKETKIKKAKDSKESLLPTQQGPVNIEKAVFVGRASDLLRELRQTQKALASDAETS